MTTAAERALVYQRIFENIPLSFLDPTQVNNQYLIGAIALAVAHTENLYRSFEQGLFIDTAALTDSSTQADGTALSSLERWGVWLQLPRLPGESVNDYRARLQSRMYAPRVTRKAIRDAVVRVTGLNVSLQETADRVFRFNEGPWHGQKLMGQSYAYMAVDVVTEGQTNAVPSVMGFLRAAGVHWRHIEVVAHQTVLDWEAEKASTNVSAWNWIGWRPNGWRPGSFRPGAPLLPSPTEWSLGESIALDTRTDWGMSAMLVNGSTVEAVYVPAGLPSLNWDNSITLWDESVWGD